MYTCFHSAVFGFETHLGGKSAAEQRIHTRLDLGTDPRRNPRVDLEADSGAVWGVPLGSAAIAQGTGLATDSVMSVTTEPVNSMIQPAD